VTEAGKSSRLCRVTMDSVAFMGKQQLGKGKKACWRGAKQGTCCIGNRPWLHPDPHNAAFVQLQGHLEVDP
jgi:hypothetical protein